MIPEPSTPLWAAVKARYDSWPPDSEDNARELARLLRGLGDTALTGGDQLTNNANTTRGHWRDEAGGVLGEKVADNGADWVQSGSRAQQLADVTERYAADLMAVKQTIVGTIDTNEEKYAELQFHDPFLAADLATQIADYLRDLVGQQTGVDTLKPPKNGTPAQNAAWWKSLSTAERDELLRDHPDWLGNLDGLPGKVRSQANMARLPTERAALERERAAAQREYDIAKLDPTGVLEWLAKGHLDEIDAKLRSLDTIEQTMAKGNRQLLLLDMSHPRAEAAIAVGDVDTARNVAVFTPGLGSTVDGGLSRDDQHMADLKGKADQIAGKGSTATVTWYGYQAPQWDLGLLDPSQSVASPEAAEAGGDSLAKFYDGIGADHDASKTPDTPPLHLTALGHSYGSTTTGYALSHDTPVDDAVLFGSPGQGADQLNVPQGHLYAERNDNDKVPSLHGTLGPSPYDSQDASPNYRQLSTDANTTELGSTTASEGHSSYLDNNSTSQLNMAAIVTGHLDLVKYK